MTKVRLIQYAALALIVALAGCNRRGDGANISCAAAQAPERAAEVAALAQWPVSAAVPTTLDESLDALDEHLTPVQKAYLRCAVVDDVGAGAHFWLGRWVRNEWGLYTRPALAKDLAGQGFIHPDDMSTAIVVTYARRLRDEAPDLAALAERSRRHWTARGVDVDAERARLSQ